MQPTLGQSYAKNGLVGGNICRIEDMLAQDACDIARVFAVLF